MMNISERRKIVEMENALSSRDKQISELNSLLDEYETRFGTVITKSLSQNRKPSLKELFIEKILDSDSFNRFCDRLTCESDISDVKLKFTFNRKSKYREKWYTDDFGRRKLLRIPYSEETLSDVRREERKHGEYIEEKSPDGTKTFTFKE